MGVATLLAWLLTVGIGGYMLRTWIARGGLRRQRATGVGAPPFLVFGHPAMAFGGLVIWICYLVLGRAKGLAWAGVGILAVAITLGICMVTMWTPYPVRDAAQPPVTPAPPEPLPSHSFTVTDEMIADLLSDPFPARPGRRRHLLPLIPVCHGFGALITFMLATLTVATGR